MTRKELKSKLLQYQSYLRELDYLNCRKNEILEKINSAGQTANFGDEKVEKTKQNSKEKIMHEFLNKSLDLDQQINELENKCFYIENIINKHCHSDNAVILKYIYLVGLSLYEVAGKISYSYSKVAKSHLDGLDEMIYSINCDNK